MVMIMNMVVRSNDVKLIERVEVQATLYGAIGETLTLSGPTNTQVVLNEHGIGSATLLTGQYNITGSISKEALPSGRTATLLESDTILTAYPSGAIFWFGNGDASGDPLYSKCGNFIHDVNIHPSEVSRGKTCESSVINNTSNIELAYTFNGYGTSYRIGAEFYMKNSISTSGYSNLNVLSSGSGKFYTVNSIVTNYSYVDKGSAGSLITLTPAPYLTFYYDDYSAYVNSSTLVKAIYLT